MKKTLATLLTAAIVGANTGTFSVEKNSQGDVSKISVFVPSADQDEYTDMHFSEIDAPGTPFKYVHIGRLAGGHPPAHWMEEHWDAHFYTFGEKTVQSIAPIFPGQDCGGGVLATAPPAEMAGWPFPAVCFCQTKSAPDGGPQGVSCTHAETYSQLEGTGKLPDGYEIDESRLIVPANGIHYFVPPTDKNTEAGNWNTFVYGGIEDKVGFFEPMVAHKVFKTANRCWDIPKPAKVDHPELRYPTKYCVRQERGGSSISIEDFAKNMAIGCVDTNGNACNPNSRRLLFGGAKMACTCP
mmetsp:Transcript_21752/g.30737  ORF Transcript_21752/g.30737 Transcript_21752/m.30737 type:complete len:297 (+) Transcript_21752:49-939(+)|eukprot:CAMPEP_0175097314 /NCGR_PEP_ID=MMETSP0086_2-20121207/5216_1 /TAXON_ID=136419 /ORGANISM="Unknown Unknown, Strain D1" /LENGTH=296 /DNA_ID=CAMNT_0016370807 /DNA_START=32 /DNA_END=922 /DNA_ORIENTATION=-